MSHFIFNPVYICFLIGANSNLDVQYIFVNLKILISNLDVQYIFFVNLKILINNLL